MSDFLCGEFVFKDALPEEHHIAIGRRLEKIAVSRDLHLQLEFNIVQKCILETLGRKNWQFRGTSLCFLLTASPLHDTSDELIAAPLCASGVGYDFAALAASLERMRGFFAEVLALEEVGRCVVVFESGWDTPCNDQECDVTEWVDRCIACYRQWDGEVPIVRFTIYKP